MLTANPCRTKDKAPEPEPVDEEGAAVEDAEHRNKDNKHHSGGCYCGAVRYRARGVKDIWYCHCSQCRALTGHFMAAACVARDQFHVDGDIHWVAVSQTSKHGFCAKCCSPLFWSNSKLRDISIVAGSLDNCTGIEVKGHIFVEEKGDYYQITDELPQFTGYPKGGVR